MILLTPKPTVPPIDPDPAEVKRRNRVGINAIFTREMSKGQKVTLEEAIAILRANW